MKLKEKFLEPLERCAKNTVDDCITDVSFDTIVDEQLKIADEFAIGFAEWIEKYQGGTPNSNLLKELLKMYKIEKNL